MSLNGWYSKVFNGFFCLPNAISPFLYSLIHQEIKMNFRFQRLRMLQTFAALYGGFQ